MRRARLWGLIGLLAAFTVGTHARPVPHATVQTAPAQAARQRLQRHRADVEKLEQAVARQESDRKQASERLQRQDEAITELRKQLQRLHAEPVTGQH
jgi:septal ring factor EnvC (AmiA/AmiB activator)